MVGIYFGTKKILISPPLLYPPLFLLLSPQMDYLYDTLLIETIYNKTLPQWTKVCTQLFTSQTIL